MNEFYPERHDVPQIPWAKHTKVTGAHYWASSGQIDSVELQSRKTKASVIANGTVHIDIDSKENIKHYMAKSPELRRSLFKYFEKAENDPLFSSFISTTLDWMKGVPFTDVEEPPYENQPGVLDWIPPTFPPTPPVIGKIGTYGSGRIKDLFEHWIGTKFNYVHIVLPSKEDVLVILWEGSEKPEVWVGDVENFFLANDEDFEDWESYQHYNDLFENGLLWALDYMGRFERSGLPEWAVELIEHDPDLLWPDLVEKLLPIRDLIPGDLDKALTLWIERRKAEAEEAAGQLRFQGFPRRKNR